MQVIHFVVPGTPPPVELHRKKGSLRLTKLRPWRHLCSGLTIIKLKKQQDNLGQTLDVRERLGISHVFAKVQFGFLTVSSNICRCQFSLKEVFFEAPCIVLKHAIN